MSCLIEMVSQGINFASYERLRMIITPPGKDHSVFRKLACGALAGIFPFITSNGSPKLIRCIGSISQTLTYPFDVLRRKMQVTGMRAPHISGEHATNSALQTIRLIARTEGLAGFYRGIWPNLLKVAPSIATS